MLWPIVGLVVIFCITLMMGMVAGMTFIESGLLKEGFRIRRNNALDPGNGRMWIERRNENGAWRSVAPIERGAG